MLADEPTGNLDGHTGQQVIDLMFSLTEKHDTTLLLITHDVKLAGRCARVVTMRDGLLSEAPRAEAGQRQAVSAE